LISQWLARFFPVDLMTASNLMRVRVDSLFTLTAQIQEVRIRGRAMFRESLPIAYDAPADLKKWPSFRNQRLPNKPPYLVYNGTLADCIRQLMSKPVTQLSLYNIVTGPQPVFDTPVLSPADAAEIALRRDFPKD
jgi:hypothetical protein